MGIVPRWRRGGGEGIGEIRGGVDWVPAVPDGLYAATSGWAVHAGGPDALPARLAVLLPRDLTATEG